MQLVHDGSPADLGLSLDYLVSTGIVVRAGLCAPSRSSVRRAWVTIGCILAVLLVSQQSDLHRSVLWWGSDLLASQGIAVRSLPVKLSCVLALLLGGALICYVLVRLLRQGKPPGKLGTVGLALIAAAGMTRSASLLHVLPWTGSPLEVAVRASTAAGLGLVMLAAVGRGRGSTIHSKEIVQAGRDRRDLTT